MRTVWTQTGTLGVKYRLKGGEKVTSSKLKTSLLRTEASTALVLHPDPSEGIFRHRCPSRSVSVSSRPPAADLLNSPKVEAGNHFQMQKNAPGAEQHNNSKETSNQDI